MHAAERRLDRDGSPVHLGSRALGILIALVERAGEIVSKKDLLARVWGDLVVDEGSLRFHIAALRKVLGEGQSGARYVMNVSGRGYCFVAHVSRRPAEGVPAVCGPTAATRLPERVVGRDSAVSNISRDLLQHRFVSIVGPGGVGKTTVATAIAHYLITELGACVHFIDLAAIENPARLCGVLASSMDTGRCSDLPWTAASGSPASELQFLILDGCEHVIGPAAQLAEAVFRLRADVHILTTSREPLRVDGERVHRLAPLECPPDEGPLSVSEVLGFPAVQLLLEHVSAGGYQLELNDANASIIAQVCRKLDGIALALELTAGRVGIYGLHGTAELVGRHCSLLWQGRRTAPPRHQTLNAMFDWSYDSLTELERASARHLATFVEPFSIEAAQAALAERVDVAQVPEMLAQLVEKSLIELDTTAASRRYRLLETTRAYMLHKLDQPGEAARAHATTLQS